ncbi:MAG: 5'-nucleotidase C-terminal domain-containing protein [Ruminococcus sp.]|jgi:2',3'-cyclic-nucleotide 2'-phosphodiesterase (5'-nucleotidase family)|nr:5'-nucleotidase C-terminal domain-containing protein [Ruminococcus sp.]
MKLKKTAAVIISFLMIIMTAIPGFAAESDTVVIFHTNDVHGYYEASDTSIGHDTIAGIFASEKDTNGAFLVSAGDMVQGSYFVNNNRGEAAMEIMSAAGYDLMTLGNHEFDYGIDRLLELRTMVDNPDFMTQAGFKGINWAAPYILESGGVKVGFFGITTPETIQSSSGGRDIDFGTFESIVKYANDTAKQLREDGAEIVISVSHMGIYDQGYGDIYKLRDSVSGVDLFIDGHSHTPLADITEDSDKPLIVSAGQYAQYLGKVTFTKGGDGWTVKAESLTPETANAYTLTENGKTAKAKVKTIIDKWTAIAAEKGKAVVANNKTAMTAVRADLRTSETVIGDFVADAIAASSGADIAFTNGGSIRADIPKGDITVADINSTLPFVNFIVMAEMDGKTLRETLEHSLSFYPDETGGFLQVSGVTVTYNPSAPAGSRIISLVANNKEVTDDAVYKVAANDWIAGGGDGYDMLPAVFAKTEPLKHPEITSLTDAVTWYIETYPDIETKTGRILQTEATPVPATGNIPATAFAAIMLISTTGLVLTRKKK